MAWGLYHGLFLVLERTRWGGWLEKFPRPLRHAYVIFAVMMGWVLFRADTFASAAHYFMALFGANSVTQAQPINRYLGNEVIWALGFGAAFSLPLWSAIKNFGAKWGEKISAPGQSLYFGIGQAIEIVLQSGKPFDLNPAPAPIRKVQHQIAEARRLASESVGEDPNRRLRILPTRLG